MKSLIVVLTVALQLQPVAAAMLCQRTLSATQPCSMGAAGAAAMPDDTTSGVTPAAPAAAHSCALAQVCAVSVPALLAIVPQLRETAAAVGSRVPLLVTSEPADPAAPLLPPPIV